MRLRAWSVAAMAFLAACTSSTEDEIADADDNALTSKDAQIVDYVFDAELVTNANDDAKKAIVSQLFWTVGPLTTLKQANAQVGRVEIVKLEERVDGAKKHVTYSAKLPVAWP